MAAAAGVLCWHAVREIEDETPSEELELRRNAGVGTDEIIAWDAT